MKRIVSVMLFAILSFTPIAAVGQPDEKYEKVSTSEFKISMELPAGAVIKMTNGKTNGGPIKELSFWGHKLALADNGIIKDGFISTKNYGKFELVSNASDGSFRIDLTPSQQKKLLELKKSKDGTE